MATPDAIAATSDAIRQLLDRAAKDTTAFKDTQVTLYQSDELQTELTQDTKPTLSVFLHRVAVSPARRNVPLRIGPRGERFRPPIPLDLFYLVTAWAGNPLVQQRLLAWAVRIIEDTSTLPSALLNDNGWAGTFAADETVELAWAPLNLQEEFDIWQISRSNQQPSASYVARTVAIESERTIDGPPRAQTMELRYAPDSEDPDVAA
jgi:hypothetical protein